MAENQKNVSGIVENLAISTDKLQETYPNGKIAIIVELDEKSYIENQFNLDMYNQSTTQFKIDISGVEIIFIRENSIVEEKPEIEEKPQKKSLIKRLKNILTFNKSS